MDGWKQKCISKSFKLDDGRFYERSCLLIHIYSHWILQNSKPSESASITRFNSENIRLTKTLKTCRPKKALYRTSNNNVKIINRFQLLLWKLPYNINKSIQATTWNCFDMGTNFIRRSSRDSEHAVHISTGHYKNKYSIRK